MCAFPLLPHLATSFGAKADPGRERKLVKRFKVDLTPPPQGLNAPEPGSTEKSVQADQSMNYRKGISKYTGFKGTI